MGAPDPGVPAAGYMVDIPGMATVSQTVGDLIDEMSGAYTYLGANAGMNGWPYETIANCLGKLDAADSPAGPDIAAAYITFYDAWGQYLDETVGALTELQRAFGQTAAQYQTSDEAVDTSLQKIKTGGYDFSKLTTLAAPTGSAASSIAARNLTTVVQGPVTSPDAERSKWSRINFTDVPKPPAGANG